MKFPTPFDNADAPVWDNYILAQAVQASLGLIPLHAHAIGLRIAGPKVEIHFQLSQVTEQDELDMDDITSEMEDLVGEDVEVMRVYEVREAPALSPKEGMRWVYRRRI